MVVKVFVVAVCVAAQSPNTTPPTAARSLREMPIIRYINPAPAPISTVGGRISSAARR